MDFWQAFWLIIISFSLVSFTYMSVKMFYKGFGELKYMLSVLETEYDKTNINK